MGGGGAMFKEVKKFLGKTVKIIINHTLLKCKEIR